VQLVKIAQGVCHGTGQQYLEDLDIELISNIKDHSRIIDLPYHAIDDIRIGCPTHNSPFYKNCLSDSSPTTATWLDFELVFQRHIAHLRKTNVHKTKGTKAKRQTILVSELCVDLIEDNAEKNGFWHGRIFFKKF
jgi:hypothetical protein